MRVLKCLTGFSGFVRGSLLGNSDDSFLPKEVGFDVCEGPELVVQGQMINGDHPENLRVRVAVDWSVARLMQALETNLNKDDIMFQYVYLTTIVEAKRAGAGQRLFTVGDLCRNAAAELSPHDFILEQDGALSVSVTLHDPVDFFVDGMMEKFEAEMEKPDAMFWPEILARDWSKVKLKVDGVKRLPRDILPLLADQEDLGETMLQEDPQNLLSDLLRYAMETGLRSVDHPQQNLEQDNFERMISSDTLFSREELDSLSVSERIHELLEDFTVSIVIRDNRAYERRQYRQLIVDRKLRHDESREVLRSSAGGSPDRYPERSFEVQFGSVADSDDELSFLLWYCSSLRRCVPLFGLF